MPADSGARVGRGEALLVALITLLGAALRFYGLGNRSLWYDEAVIYHVVQGGWRDILVQNALENSAPPLYALLLGLLTGPDATEGYLRMLSAVAGVGAIPACFALGRQFLPARSAWLVPLLVAVAPAQVIYSQQLREYSLTTTVAALMLLAFVRFIREPGTRRAAWLAAAAALGILTQYGLGLLLVAANAVCIAALALARRPAGAWARWVASQLPAALVAVVLYFTVVRHQMGLVQEAGLGYLEPYYWDGTAQGLLTLATSPNHTLVGFASPGPLALGLWALGLVAFLLGARSALATALCLAPLALGLGAAMAGLYPYGGIRQDIYLTAMIYPLIGLGADRLLALLPAAWPGAVAAGVAALLAPVLALPGLAGTWGFVNEPVGYQPMRQLVQTLALQRRPDEPVYVYYNAIPAFRYYWRYRQDEWIAGSLHRSFMDKDKVPAQMARVQEELRVLMERGQPYWVVISHLSTDDEAWLQEYIERYARVEFVEQGNGSALLYVTPRG